MSISIKYMILIKNNDIFNNIEIYKDFEEANNIYCSKIDNGENCAFIKYEVIEWF